MANLSGLAALGSSIYPGYIQGQQQLAQLQQQQLQRRKLLEEIASTQQDKQAGGIAFDALSGGGGGGPQPTFPGAQQMGPQPQQMAPGQPSQPMQRPPGPQQANPGATAQPSPQPPQQVQNPAAAQGAPQPMPPVGGFDIKTLAERIKAKNPGADNAVLFQALMKAQALMAPQAKQDMQLLVAEIRNAAAVDRVNAQKEIAAANITSREGIADLKLKLAELVEKGRDTRAAASEQGKDDRLNVTEGGKDRRQDVSEGGKDKRAAGKAQTADGNKEYQEYGTQLRSTNAKITDLIRENEGILPGPSSPKRAEYNTLKAKRDALFDKMTDARKKARAAGTNLPSVTDAVKGESPSNETAKSYKADGGTKDAPAKPQTQADFDALPKGAYYLDPQDNKLYQKP